ncbi:MAG TPA: PEPxxWA-CTERM sorting domain-containing protein [Caulobacteraceae bacterium]|jgi:hypothetical protein
MKLKLALACATAAVVVGAAQGAYAGTVIWTNWTSATNGATAGTATGTAGAVGVSYVGEVESLVANYPSWNPASSYVGGTVGNAPPQTGGIIQLFGATGATDTITFSKAVTNPILAIWSLGQTNDQPSFNFPANEPVTIEAGGPSAEYNGAPITQTGNDILGIEGNGTVQLTGTFNSISWTNPVAENWYGFTVGVAAVPEPASWAMMLLGVGLVGGGLRLARRKSVALAAA